MALIRTVEEAIDAILATYSNDDQATIRVYYDDVLPFIVWNIQDRIDKLGMRTGNNELLEACAKLPLPAGVSESELDKEEHRLLYAVLAHLKAAN